MSRRRRKRRGVKSAAGYLRIAERNRRVNEAKHDQTRQRRFERNFLSRDLPDSKAGRGNRRADPAGAADCRGQLGGGEAAPEVGMASQAPLGDLPNRQEPRADDAGMAPADMARLEGG